VEKRPPLPPISCNGSGIGFSGFAAASVSAGSAEEDDEVGEELPAGSAAMAVQASAEVKASVVIRAR